MSEQSVFQAGDFNYEECSLLSSSGVSYPDFEKQVLDVACVTWQKTDRIGWFGCP